MRIGKRAHGALVIAAMIGLAGAAAPARAGGPEYPAFDTTVEGLTKVVSTADGSTPLYDLYEDRETGKLLAVLPAGFESQMLMIACTISGGDAEAGVMGPTYYAKWQKIDRQLALIEPNLGVRTDGDAQAKASIESLYTGRVLVSTPIVAMAPGNRPVIDLGSIATKNASAFFGPSPFGEYGPGGGTLNHALARLTKAKAFPENLVVEYQAPRAGDGQIVSISYSIGELSGTPGFEARHADPRVGYFYDSFQDFSRTANDDLTDRFISRWSVEKADPSLRMSPPKRPIVWYVEHTTPIKYRRYVREGIEMWNQAFAEIGISGALEVYQQDAATGAYMDLDPEDARYNFFRWNASDQGYAIGPSRTNPFTGEILDADVVWHQGLTRSIRGMLENMSDDLTEEAFSPETLAWFEDHPDWDPRVRLAPPERAAEIAAERAVRLGRVAEHDLGRPEHPWTRFASDQTNSACRMGSMLASNFALLGAAFEAGMLEGEGTGEGADLLDGLPEVYVGQMIRYISAHEVGHCLGLQHNMAASTIRSLKEINSPGFTGPSVGSVMEYAAVNINHELGEVQGPYATTEIGPYDKWAIAFGYGPKDQVDGVLARVAEPEHLWLAQPAMSVGSDPRNMTWDLGSDNLEFARSRLSLVHELQGKLLTDIVDEGESWAVVRRRFSSLMGARVQMLAIASNWIGSSYTSYDFKGDPNARPPVWDVPADKQREALTMIIENALRDDAYGLTPELVRHMGKEYWWDPQGINELLADPSLTVHDMVGGVQATALTLIMNPTRLRRVYDNEFRAEDDAPLTLAELVTTVTDEVWSEYRNRGNDASSFRRNLQREHVGRLATLALLDGTSPSLRTIGSLAASELRRVDALAQASLGANPDAYVRAHLEDTRARIARALEAVELAGS